LLFAVFALHAAIPFIWLLGRVGTGHVPETDWFCLRLAGERFLAGDWELVYSQSFVAADNHWLYPPFGLYLAALPALLPPLTSYAALVAVELLAAGLALWLLLTAPGLEPGTVRRWHLIAAALAGCAPFCSVLVIGQSSALLLLTAVGAMRLWRADRPLGAGLLLGLLWLKPNWALPFALLTLLVDRRVLQGMLLAGLGWLLASLPLGLGLWRAFVASSRGFSQLVLTDYPAFKIVTVHGFARGILGPGPWLWFVWLCSALLLGAALLKLWLADRRFAGDAGHRLGVGLLFAVSANVYTNHYDALVLALPAWRWWVGRASYASPWRWRTIGLLLALIWSWDWAVFYYPELLGFGLDDAAFSILGPTVAAWLLLEALDAVLAQAPTTRSTRPAETQAGADDDSRTRC